MKSKSESKNGWWMQFKRPIVARIALVAFLVAGVGFTAVAQSFYNLDFESATFVSSETGGISTIDHYEKETSSFNPWNGCDLSLWTKFYFAG